MLNEYTNVKAAKNLSDKVLIGAKGTIVLIYNSPRPAYEVEFFNNEGDTVEVLTVLPSDVQKIDDSGANFLQVKTLLEADNSSLFKGKAIDVLPMKKKLEQEEIEF
jgi:hypothetical protein